MEVPLCYLSVTMMDELWEFRVLQFGNSSAESWLVKDRGEPPAQDATLGMGERIFKPLIDIEYRTLANILWDVAQCGSSDVFWGWAPTRPPEVRSVYLTLTDPPEAGLGLPGGGNLNAFSIMLTRTVRRALLDHATGLRPLALELAKKFGGDIAGFFAGTMGWPKMVDFAWSKLREAHGGQESRTGIDRYQSRIALKFEVSKAGALFLASCSPLTKAITTRRSIQEKWSNVVLALHTMLDLVLLFSVMLWASVVFCAKELGDGGQNAADAIADVLATNRNFAGAVRAFVDHKCYSSTWSGCDDRISALTDTVRQMAGMLHEPFQQLFLVLKHLAMPVRYLMILGMAFIGFCWLSSYLASASLPKSVQFPRRSLLNMGIAGPLHLAAIITEEHLKKVLDILMQLIVLRGFVLSVVMAASLTQVKPESFMALISNRIISRTQLLIAWLALWLGPLAKTKLHKAISFEATVYVLVKSSTCCRVHQLQPCHMLSGLRHMVSGLLAVDALRAAHRAQHMQKRQDKEQGPPVPCPGSVQVQIFSDLLEKYVPQNCN